MPIACRVSSFLVRSEHGYHCILCVAVADIIAYFYGLAFAILPTRQLDHLAFGFPLSGPVLIFDLGRCHLTCGGRQRCLRILLRLPRLNLLCRFQAQPYLYILPTTHYRPLNAPGCKCPLYQRTGFNYQASVSTFLSPVMRTGIVSLVSLSI